MFVFFVITKRQKAIKWKLLGNFYEFSGMMDFNEGINGNLHQKFSTVFQIVTE
jgi:hypothetical protein